MDNKDLALVEILSLIQSQSISDDENVFTFYDLLKRCNVGELKLRRTMRELINDGTVECVWAYKTNIAGVSAKRICYRLSDKAQDKAAAQS